MHPFTRRFARRASLVLLASAGLLGIPAGVPGAHAQAPASESASCSPAGDLGFVCSLINVEDFLPVEDGHWLVGSSLKLGSAGLYLIDTAAKTARPVELSIASQPDPRYAGCPAPDLKRLMTHGLDVVPGRNGLSTVYAVNHGGRESVEIFRLNPAADTAEWIGCAILPEGANGNAVASLPRGGFVVTKFMDTRDKQGFQHMLAGQVTGTVYRWSTGKGFTEVPGTRLPGDNGVVASRDGRWLFVNAYGSRQIYRVPLFGHGKRSLVEVDFDPDNLRWAPDGTLFVTGQFLTPGKPAGQDGWAAVRLDPATMSVTPLVKEPGRPQFADATSTVQVGDTLWFCTFRGDRIAYRKLR
jgi:hypothetical protein